MLTFSSSVRVESATHPGVFYLIKKRSEGRRIQLRALLKDITPETTQLEQQITAIGPMPHSGITAENLTEIQTADQKHWMAAVTPLIQQYEELIHDRVNPVWVRWALHSVEGITVEDLDGKPQSITGQNAADLLPEDLFAEAVEAVKDACQLGPVKAKNSQSPIISSAPVVGETPDTPAENVERGAYTEGGTAFGTSPTT